MEHGGVWAARPHSTPVPSAPVITPVGRRAGVGGNHGAGDSSSATTRRTLLTGWRTWLLLPVACLFEALGAA
jgi:hypothetical protein